jgi:hypothetical protein
MIRVLCITAILMLAAGTKPLFAWGCDGHRAVAILAQRFLPPATLTAVKAVLEASPIDPHLKRFCSGMPSDVIADQATWADDVRAVDPATAPWHFIDFPRAVDAGSTDYRSFCPGGACIIDAIVHQYQTLTTASDPKTKADALRFLLHFLGDIHQPLHAITNGDRGGNCLPVTYLGHAPTAHANTFTPNLHHVWDTDTIATFMAHQGLEDATALARFIEGQNPHAGAVGQAPTTAGVLAWARESSQLARTTAYGRLARKPPVEPADALVNTCADNNHVGQRLEQLHEKVNAQYEEGSVPVISVQLLRAAQRLASLLVAAFPNP